MGEVEEGRLERESEGNARAERFVQRLTIGRAKGNRIGRAEGSNGHEDRRRQESDVHATGILLSRRGDGSSGAVDLAKERSREEM